MVESRDQEKPSYPNWQRKRIQNPYSVSSNLTEGTANCGYSTMRVGTGASSAFCRPTAWR